MRRFKAMLLLAVIGFMPSFVFAQSAEEDETEVVRSTYSSEQSQPGIALEKAATLVVRQTNTFRADEGLSKLEVDSNLESAARYFAEYMARTDKYGHSADGSRPSERAKDHGYDYCIVLENIAYFYNSSGFTAERLGTKAFRGWKNSPGHRKNMLDPDVTQTGVALAQSDKTGYYYAVQMFGRPKQQSIEFSIVNNAGATVEYEIADRAFTLPPRLTRTHTRCRPSEVTFQWPGSGNDSEVVEPDDGDKLKVFKNDSRFQVKRE
jgi:uncharacterized protein YkwD